LTTSAISAEPQIEIAEPGELSDQAIEALAALLLEHSEKVAGGSEPDNQAK
jgi:hypothetical protein